MGVVNGTSVSDLEWPWRSLLKVIPRLQAFSGAIHRTFVQYFTRFQLTARSRGPSATARFFVSYATEVNFEIQMLAIKLWVIDSIAFHSSNKFVSSALSHDSSSVYSKVTDCLSVLLSGCSLFYSVLCFFVSPTFCQGLIDRCQFIKTLGRAVRGRAVRPSSECVQFI